MLPLLLLLVGSAAGLAPSKPLDTDTLAPHPRLRLTPDAVAAMEAKIARDPLAATVAEQLRKHGEALLVAPLVNCSLAGVEDSLLSQARSVLDRTYTLALLWSLDGNATWAKRAVRELLHVTADASCASWNPHHFLDTAEMMHAVAVGYDWLFLAPPAVLSAAQRQQIAEGLATRGLQIAADNWKGWFFTAAINWNEVCNGGAIAASLALLDSHVPAHAALAAAVLKNATRDIRFSEMTQYAPDGAWSEGPTYWGYATKYSLVAIQMLTTATGSDGGLGAAPGFDRTGKWCVSMLFCYVLYWFLYWFLCWFGTGLYCFYAKNDGFDRRIHNTGPLDKMFNWGDSDDDGADEFVVDFMGLASMKPTTTEAAVAAYWGRNVFNRTLRCDEAGCALALLDWPSPSLGAATDLEALPKCASFRFSDAGWDNKTALGYFRSDWRQSKCADWNRAARPGFMCEPRKPEDQPVWLAFKGGNGQANHNDLDAGSFVFEMAGHRWAVDLGSDSYGLPDYFSKSSAHGKRYSYYRKSTRGHNTLTFDGRDEQPGWCAQDEHSVSAITVFNCSDARAPHAVVDLTPAYAKAGGPHPPSPRTSSVLRGFAVLNNFSQIVVKDEWTAKGAANVTWAMHFPGSSDKHYSSEAVVKVSTDGRTATLTAVSSPQTTITASIDVPQTAKFEVVTPVILTGKVNPTGGRPSGSLRKLIVVLDPKVEQTLQVSFALPGTPAVGRLNPLAHWAKAGALAA